jgi:hypothetical protein
LQDQTTISSRPAPNAGEWCLFVSPSVARFEVTPGALGPGDFHPDQRVTRGPFGRGTGQTPASKVPETQEARGLFFLTALQSPVQWQTRVQLQT